MRHSKRRQQRQPVSITGRDCDVSRSIADYLKNTGFRTLADALAFYAGNAAPPRSEGMIEFKKQEANT